MSLELLSSICDTCMRYGGGKLVSQHNAYSHPLRVKADGRQAGRHAGQNVHFLATDKAQDSCGHTSRHGLPAQDTPCAFSRSQ